MSQSSIDPRGIILLYNDMASEDQRALWTSCIQIANVSSAVLRK
jgi:hypothetical protein